ncbi:diguanylate cyclase AdrA [Saccharobesus litoralis]|uniref:diguanylate cyclase n=2 Tax=Saccharobesus litoralis TaxID=2172099 RepID=A0A2S0VWP3_9ALTE|nr:diguanylate cyclase AdrA [Saccharobesus litoralis]
MPANTYKQGIGFVKRLYMPRVFGSGLGAISMAAVLQSLGHAWYWWLLLFINGFVWPHVAFTLSRYAVKPYDAEIRNLKLDSLFAAFWLPIMHFNLLPSILIVAWMSFNNISAGGGKLFVRGLTMMLAGIVVGCLIYGLQFNIEPSLTHMYAAVPVLLIYPLFLGYVTYNLSRRLRVQRHKLDRASRLDSLTQLYNRHYWEELVSSEHIKCERHNYKASIVLIDIDGFKQVNDKFGHMAGDKALQMVASCIQENIRQCDELGRYAGEEFGILLTDTSGYQALTLASKLRHKINSLLIPAIEGSHLQVTIGVAEYSATQMEYNDWLTQADQALADAKKLGRNQIALAAG